MADSNKLVTLIVLGLVGLVAVVVGVLNILFNRRDRATIDRLVADGAMTQAQANELTSPMWMWLLSVTQILLGVGLIVWGIFQYFIKVDDVIVVAKEAGEKVRNATTRLNPMTRRNAGFQVQA